MAMAGEAIRQLTGEIDFPVREVTISNALAMLWFYSKALRLR